MIFRDVIIGFKEYKKNFVKPTTYSAYLTTIKNHIEPYFGDFENTIHEKELQKFVLLKSQRYSKRYVKDVVTTLKTILKFARKNDIFDYPEYNIEYPNNFDAKEMITLTKDQCIELKSYLMDNFSFRNLGILIALTTGVRIGEICGLKWGDINFETKTIRIQRTVQRIVVNHDGKLDRGKNTKLHIGSAKTKTSNRTIPLDNDVVKIAKSLNNIVSNDNYIVSNSAKPIDSRVFREYQKRLFAKLNLPKLRFHDIRHTFATICIQNKVDIKTVSSILGHSDVSITLNTYTHPSIDDKRSAINNLF